jgi:hypothetical protein
VRNLLIPEEYFEEFKLYCREAGFDLCYFSNEITGSLREIENYQFDKPCLIRLKKKRFGYCGIPYAVAKWQQAQWNCQLSDMVCDNIIEIHNEQDGGLTNQTCFYR